MLRCCWCRARERRQLRSGRLRRDAGRTARVFQSLLDDGGTSLRVLTLNRRSGVAILDIRVSQRGAVGGTGLYVYEVRRRARATGESQQGRRGEQRGRTEAAQAQGLNLNHAECLQRWRTMGEGAGRRWRDMERSPSRAANDPNQRHKELSLRLACAASRIRSCMPQGGGERETTTVTPGEP